MDKPNPFIHLFKTPGGYYIYDVNTSTILRTKKEIFDTLMMEQKGTKKNDTNIINNDCNHLINTMKSQGFLSSRRAKEIEHPADEVLKHYLDNKIRMMILQITQQCNLRCDYCSYSGSYLNREHSNKKMSFETAKKSIDFLISNSRNVKKIHIGFYGGEPLLEYDLMKKCIQYAENASEGKEITFNMTTNGTLLTNERMEFFCKHNVGITISLDGPKEIHDKNRKFSVSGCGTFETIKENLTYLREIYPEYFNKSVMFSAVIDKENDFSCLNEFFTSYDTIKDSMIVFSDKAENYIKSKEETANLESNDTRKRYELFKLFLNKLDKLDEKYVSKIVKNHHEELKKKFFDERDFSKQIPNKAHHSGPCIPGVDRLFVDVDGNFFPCEKVSENSVVMNIGHIDSGFNIEKIRNILNIGKLTSKDCINCWAIKLCLICAVSADDIDKLSSEKKCKNCIGVKDILEKLLIDYCMLNEFGYSFEDGIKYYQFET